MHHVDPALLTIAWATVAGLLAQVVGARWRIPAIVPLLVMGMLLGPSGLGVVQPASLGGGLSVIVKLAVAVILFDGALNLRLRELRQAAREVRNLVTIGVLVTWIGATLIAWSIAQLSLPVAIVFGALMTVTGPTVVQPLLRRVPLPRPVKTVLEGEAIIIDPIGAVLAVAVVDIVLGFQGVAPLGVIGGAWAYVGRLLVGLVCGVAGGFLLSFLLKRPKLVPHELANLVTLAAVWGVFAISEQLAGESGIVASVAMGLAMQRGAVPSERRIRAFKEQLTVLGISLLFLLLAANLPLSVVIEEGWRGLLTVLGLMLIVRPISVWISLRNGTMGWREMAFISWISPRGIVAASVASLFALTLTEAGLVEGHRVLAITFLTIALTVTIQGLTANTVARLLGLQNMGGRAVVVVGAGPLGLALAETLRRHDRPVMLIDRNSALVRQASAAGFETYEGNALDEDVLASAQLQETETMVAVTTNSEVNTLASHIAADAFGVSRAYPALGPAEEGVSERLLERVGGRIAFGRALNVRAWEGDLAAGRARTFDYVVPVTNARKGAVTARDLPDSIVPLAVIRGGSLEIVTAETKWQGGDTLAVLTTEAEDAASALLNKMHTRESGAT
ncbi:MAG: cation:proton antiporter [Gemmatimonadaceae bacterium]|nr:cation:proton antiporter [Gemmatimonadaceae bacterium]